MHKGSFDGYSSFSTTHNPPTLSLHGSIRLRRFSASSYPHFTAATVTILLATHPDKWKILIASGRPQQPRELQNWNRMVARNTIRPTFENLICLNIGFRSKGSIHEPYLPCQSKRMFSWHRINLPPKYKVSTVRQNFLNNV